MTPEESAHALLLAALAQPQAQIFPPTDDSAAPPSPEELSAHKAAADLLVQHKLARFADDGRTAIALTNAGRYWALSGGYMAFLKEPEPGRASGGGGGRERNPELEEIRLTLMRRRLDTFWWSFSISIAGFIFSIISLTVALTLGDRFLGR